MKHLIFISMLISLGYSLHSQSTTEINFEEYGNKQSVGVAIGGGGILGVPFRYNYNNKLTAEVGAFYRPVFLVDGWTDQVVTSSSVMLSAGGYYFTGNKIKDWKNKWGKRGVFLKAGHSIGKFSDSFIAAGWSLENFRIGRKNQSYIFDIGAGASFNHWTDKPENYRYQGSDFAVTPLIYWKMHWNWYINKNKS